MRTVGVTFALFALLCLVTKCSPRQLGATAAESAYTAELLRCIDESATREEAQGCRHAVNLAWGIAEVSRDGGK
jgi:hypothetical protein